jgi:hypothetical protein
MLFMGLLCFVYLICSLRTNVVFVIIFLSLVVAFSLLAATYFLAALGDADTASRTQVVRFSPPPPPPLSIFPATWHANTHLGRRRYVVRDFYGRLVDIFRNHACSSRLPLQYSCWRSLDADQGSQHAHEGEGEYGVD